MTTHTQGPWHRGGKKGLIVYGPKGYPICSCDTHHGTHQEWQDEANADLIAAAPELLKEAIAVIERWDSPLWKDLPATAEYIRRLRKAVAKAQGGLA